MSETTLRQIVLAARLQSEVRPNDFRLEEAAKPKPGPGNDAAEREGPLAQPLPARPPRRSEVLSRSGRIEVASVLKVKSDLPLRDRRERIHFLHLAGQAVDVLDEDLNDRRRAVVAALQLLHADGYVLVMLDDLPHANEGANYGNAHLDCSVAV